MYSMKYTLFVLCISFGFHVCACGPQILKRNLTVDEEDKLIYSKYIKLDKLLKQLVSSGTKMALPMLMEASEGMNLSSSCMSNILQLMTGIRKLKLSAVKFLDATGKPSEGYLDGNMHLLGDYQQCLDTSVMGRNGKIAFRGQYCLLHYTPLLPRQKRPVTFDSGIEELVEATRNTSEVLQFIISKAQLFYYNPSKFGVCVPSGCSKGDMDQIVSYLGEKLYFDASVAYCDMDDEEFMNTKNIAFTCVFVLLGIFAVIGTALEYYTWKRNASFKNIFLKSLMCFSILTNFPKAISTTPSEGSIACLHGVRALTLFYIILLHQYYAIVKYFISSHVTQALEEIPQFFMQIVTNGFLTADVFFLVGGLVNTYSRMKMNDSERRKKNVFLLINHRLWRIGPPYLFFCLMESLYRPYGPMRVYEKTEYVDKCDKFWWQNVLFINNYFLQDDTCSPHSWYIAADMQLFLLSLFTMPLFFKNPKSGVIVNSAMVVLGIIFTVCWSWATNVTPGVIFYRPNRDEINKAWNTHTYTFSHIAPYFTGILMGYFLSIKNEIKIPKIYQAIGWPAAACLLISVLFVSKVWNSGGAFSIADSAFYYGFSKFLFPLAVAWMVLCCIAGDGGIINYILCLPLWIPIARISFVVYLIAPFLQSFYFSNSRTMVDGHRMTLIWRYAGDIAISLLLGLVLYVLVESSYRNLEKLLFQRWSTNAPEENVKSEVIANSMTFGKSPKKCELELGPERFLPLYGKNL